MEKQEVNSVGLLRKSKSLGKPMKQGITDSPNALIDTELFQQWLDNLDAPTKDAFYSFARDTFSFTQAYLYARFLGYGGSITSTEAWMKEYFPKANHLQTLLVEIEKMTDDIAMIRQDIDSFAMKRETGAARIASLQKELRSTIAHVDSFISTQDRKGLLLAGADRCLRELTNIFKDGAFENPLKEASMGVWAKIQYEE